MSAARPHVAAFLGTQALGDYVMQHLAAASVARALGARLTVLFRDDRPYKGTVNRLNPRVDRLIGMPENSEDLLPLDVIGQGDDPPDILLTPSMLDLGRCVGPPPRLRLPADLDDPLRDQLVARGLAPDRWHACLHLRQSGYLWRLGADPHRNVDPLSYLPMVRRIVEDHGGQVVRLGDPSMTPFPALPGLVELGREPDTFPLQVHALAHARFFIGTDTGPTQLACALGVPAATTNALGIGVWNDGDLVLFKGYRRRDGGDRVPVADLVGMNPMLGNERPSGLDFEDAAPETLVRVADHMVAVTDHPRPAPEAAPPPVPRLPFPLPWRDMADMADLTVWE
ncbi:MAG: TIGR04372 family glycosyltransferase [Hyphomicrobiales bacterium]|nr:TIGR04372 family glycosyltransferase [Hyphomicrobiales bacterium]MCP5373643.1 TIGR04372 family glycosyltransferase [Hyphomicrobiales bacterium]